jgi:choline kinase
MDAVIVAAGAGTRMMPLTADTHKCLLPVNGRPLIDYSLTTLKSQGIDKITIVTGHQEQKMYQALSSSVDRFVVNPFYKITNNMASLWFAGKTMEEDFLYLHADLLYHQDILAKFLDHPFSFASICVEEKDRFGGEEMKVGREGNHIILGKEIPDNRAMGEFIGIAAFKKDNFHIFHDIMTKILSAGGYNSYFAEAIALASRTHQVEMLTFSGIPWIEIDTEDDLGRARNETINQVNS